VARTGGRPDRDRLDPARGDDLLVAAALHGGRRAAIHWSILLVVSLWALLVQPGFDSAQRFAIDFTAGIVLYVERERIARAFAALPSPAIWLLLTCGLAILTAPRYLRIERRLPIESIDVRDGRIDPCGRLLGGLGFVALTAALSIAVAPLGYYGVERPAIRAGNRVCAALARRFGGIAQPSRIVSPRPGSG
jgi:hypothetical protein